MLALEFWPARLLSMAVKRWWCREMMPEGSIFQVCRTAIGKWEEVNTSDLFKGKSPSPGLSYYGLIHMIERKIETDWEFQRLNNNFKNMSRY